MMQVRRSEERGRSVRDWLDSHHSFSFGEYHDPEFMGFCDLRVINEDFIAGGAGFPMHGHRDMEILTYIVSGAVEHRDSLGHTSVIRAGDLQRMSAGQGIRHSELNHLAGETTHLLQVWILPDNQGLEPSYEQKNFSDQLAREPLVLVGARDGRDGALTIHQDVNVHAARWRAAGNASLELAAGRSAWVQVAAGSLMVNGSELGPGDGAALRDERTVIFSSQGPAEFLVFDLA